LFGEPAVTGDDLFGSPEAPPLVNDSDAGLSSDTTSATEDLFGSPTAADDSSSIDLDSLFGDPAPQSPGVEPKQESSTSLDELFQSTDLRTWKDNTGAFEVEAKLAVIYPDKVRLLKTNGNYCTVPMRRLSDSDRQLVEQIASQLPAGDVKFVSTAH
jgi:hypothetical protein